MNNKKLKLFIGYYYYPDDTYTKRGDTDFEIYTGITGTKQELIKHLKANYEESFKPEDIVKICLLTKVIKHIDNKKHKITIKID